MKKIFFDSGPLVTLSLTDLLGVLKKLKETSNVKFYITPKVKREVIDKPILSKQFKFEALRILRLLESGIIEIYDHPKLEEKTEELLHIANKCFKAKGQEIEIVHFGEMQTLAAAIIEQADAIAVDERTTRILLESSIDVGLRLEKKLHTKVEFDRERLAQIKEFTKKINVLRSTELMMVAYEKGLLNDYLLDLKNPKEELLDAVLWAIKLSGCSISEDEINETVSLELNEHP